MTGSEFLLDNPWCPIELLLGSVLGHGYSHLNGRSWSVKTGIAGTVEGIGLDSFTLFFVKVAASC